MTTRTEPVLALADPGTMGEFGQELRRRRTAAGLTLRSLADRVAFDYSYLAQVERGVRPGSARLAYRCDQELDARGRLVRLFADRRLRQLMHEGRGTEPDDRSPFQETGRADLQTALHPSSPRSDQ